MANSRLSRLTPLDIPLSVFDFFFCCCLSSISALVVCYNFVSLDLQRSDPCWFPWLPSMRQLSW